MIASLGRRLLAELVGTALLVTVVLGSGIAAQELSPHDVGLQLLENSTATVFGLAVLILLFGPVSGAHLNPVVSAADWLLGRRAGTGLTGRDVAAYTVAQIVGAVCGAVLANAMFDLAPLQISEKVRASTGLWIGEIVATAGLIALIFALARRMRPAHSWEAAMWAGLNAVPAESAGTHPATRIHPGTLAVARRHDIALKPRTPRALDEVVRRGDIVITVCDRARGATRGPAPHPLVDRRPDQTGDRRGV